MHDFTIDGTATSDGSVPYDYHLRVNANEVDSINENWTYGGTVYGIAFYNSDHELFVPVTYSNTYRFYVNRGMDFYTIVKTDGTTGIPAGYYLPAVNVTSAENEYEPYRVTDEETLFYLDGKLPFVYSYAEPTGTNGAADRWTTRSAFTTSVGGGNLGDVEITECGTIYTQNSSFSSEQNLLIENVKTDNADIKDNVYKKINYSRDKDSNQYSYSIKNPETTPVTVYTRTYVKYSYTYRGAKIDAVAYGPVNMCEYTAANN